MDSKEKELKLSKFLLQKYSDIINEREQRTIGEIKTLVNGSDLTIQSIIREFTEANYEFEKDYSKVLEKLFDFIKDELEFVETNFGINYWLSPKEIMEIKVVDDEDMAAFTCSCMKALGDEKAEVIIAELDNLKTHAFVTTEINGNFLLLDAAQKHEFNKYLGDKVSIIRDYKFKEFKIKRFLYRFNYNKYEQFLEEE